MASIVEPLVRLLASTQRSEEGPRKKAEADLKQAEADPGFPKALAAIAAGSYTTQIRQSALSVLRRFIDRNWSEDVDDDEDEGPRIAIDDATKAELRAQLLELATRDEDDRRVKASVRYVVRGCVPLGGPAEHPADRPSYVVGKIASVDYPERWPDLLDRVLAVIRDGTDLQLHGALRVLSDLVDDSLSEGQFFAAAKSIVEVLYLAALNGNRKASLRALAVSVFRSSFDLMDMVKTDHLTEVKDFAHKALAGWLPFFHDVMKLPIPDAETQQDDSNSVVALKLQVVKTLIKIKSVFPSLLLPESFAFFQEAWGQLSGLVDSFAKSYLLNEDQGRLEDSDGLPYTLDFLVLEELDFLNHCLRATPVQKELELQLHANAHETPWMRELMALLVAYSRVTREEEDLWDIDASLYLAEETSVTANYTARTACGDLLIKMVEWIGQRALEGLFAHTQLVFGGDAADWRSREAAFYLFNMLISDLMDCQKTVPPEICEVYLKLVEVTLKETDQPLLVARAYLVAGTLSQCYPEAVRFFDAAIVSIASSSSELVSVACIKAAESFIKSGAAPVDRQVPVLQAVERYAGNRDFGEIGDADDLLVTLTETLRAAIGMNRAIVINSDIKSLDLLFTIAKHGAQNFQITMLINEAFEEVVQTLSDSTSYAALCAKVLPTINGFLGFSDVTKDESLVTVGTPGPAANPCADAAPARDGTHRGPGAVRLRAPARRLRGPDRAEAPAPPQRVQRGRGAASGRRGAQVHAHARPPAGLRVARRAGEQRARRLPADHRPPPGPRHRGQLGFRGGRARRRAGREGGPPAAGRRDAATPAPSRGYAPQHRADGAVHTVAHPRLRAPVSQRRGRGGAVPRPNRRPDARGPGERPQGGAEQVARELHQLCGLRRDPAEVSGSPSLRGRVSRAELTVPALSPCLSSTISTTRASPRHRSRATSSSRPVTGS